MKQITVYSFNELSEDVQDRVLADMWDINIFHDWWEMTTDETEELIKLEITAFDIDRRTISLQFIDSATDTADKILANHGDTCNTYRLAQSFLSDRDALVEKHSNGVTLDIVEEDNEDAFDTECDELEAAFLHALGEEYLSILDKEYEYLSSREAIVETIEANEYLFTKNGTRI